MVKIKSCGDFEIMTRTYTKEVRNNQDTITIRSKFIQSLKTIKIKRLDYFALQSHCNKFSKYWKTSVPDSFIKYYTEYL